MVKLGLAGATGFIGSRIASHAERAGYDLSFAGKPPYLPPRDASTLVWAAGRKRDDIASLYHDHVDAPLAFLAAHPAVVQFVYFSSGEVYGATAVPFREPLTSPQTPYAKAKLEGETRLAAQCDARGVTFTVVRPAVVYGPGGNPSMAVHAAVAAVRQRQRLALTPGQQTRDFIHVEDVALAVMGLIARRRAGVFNISSNHALSIEALCRQVADIAEIPFDACFDLGRLPYRNNEQMQYQLDNTALTSALGFAPSISLAAGLRELLFAKSNVRS